MTIRKHGSYFDYVRPSPSRFSTYQEDIQYYFKSILQSARDEGLDPDPEGLYQWLDTMSAEQLACLYDRIQHIGAEAMLPPNLLS